MKNRILAFIHAFRGIGNLFQETHFKVHVLALCTVVCAGFYFQISSSDWVDVLLISALVLSLEAMNSGLESLADAVHPNQHPLIKRAKDVAAGAVLIAAIIAIVIAGIIFAPYF